MRKKLVEINLTDSIKAEIMKTIDETIDKVMNVHNHEIDERLRGKIRNLSLDQVNVNVTTRANLRTLWILSDEDNLPLIVEKEKALPNFDELSSENSSNKMYKMKPNLTWTFNKENIVEGGVNKDNFKKKAIEMLIEDIETASFYGALSYANDVNV